jgi:alpha-glucosidase
MKSFEWWQKAVFYQIYPRSFADGNGDGIGDLMGMIEKLDYLKDLGVNAIWLSPHFPSPLEDCGYDISDYCDVAPEYGTLDDFRRFLDGLHQRDMHLVLDLVLNHTSDQHAWFQESRSSKENPKRDWYIWRPGRDGGLPPNNWASTFGGSAWELDPLTSEYYYHFFFKGQPDLNWNNPQVREAMWQVVRFWLEMGVDGFRLDAVGTIFEDPALPDHDCPVSLDELYRLSQLARSEAERDAVGKWWEQMFRHQHDFPEVHDLMRELRTLVDSYPGRVLIGETDDLAFYGNGTDELHLNFNFPLMRTQQLSPTWVRQNQQQRLGAMPPGAWPCNTLGNHDSPRLYNRFGNGKEDAQLARLNAALILTLRGTPFLYNGEEIGMTDGQLTDIHQFRDPLSLRAYRLSQELLGATPEEALALASQSGRDKCRLPMQWCNAPNGGFCPEGVQPWLPVKTDYAAGVNVAEQQLEKSSLWHFYRRLLHVRQQAPALQVGDYVVVDGDATDYLAFLRSMEQQRVLVVLNYSAQAQQLSFPALGQRGRILFSSQMEREGEVSLSEVRMSGFEVLVLEVEA